MKRTLELAGLLICTLLLVVAASGAETEEGTAAVTLTTNDGLYTLHAQDVPLGEVLARMEAETSVQIDVDPELSEKRVSLDLANVTYEKLIEAVAGSHALIYERDAEGNERLVSARVTSQMLLDQRDLTRSERRDVRRKTKQVRKALKRLDDIYGYAGVLDYDEAKSLIKQRKAEEQAIIDELAALGPGGARALHDVYGDPGLGQSATRGQFIIVKALEKIDDPESPLVLGAIYDEDERYSLQREVVAALGHRTDSLGAIQSILKEEDDMRLLGPSMMALSNKPDGLDTLAAVIRSEDANRDVRQEAIRSVGEIGGESAMTVLSDIASDPNANVSVRVSAIAELARTYGTAATGVLNSLESDPNETIRATATKKLGGI